MKTNRDDLVPAFLPHDESLPVEWLIADGLTDYDAALAFMESALPRLARARHANSSGSSSIRRSIRPAPAPRRDDLLVTDRFPVYATGRGGEYTYHGPGQRVAYVMLDLKRRREDIRAFVTALEQWIISTLASFNVKGERREDRVGVWVRRPERPALADGSPAEDKIAAIGIRLRKWVSFHGISINVEPDLAHFDGIVPCGVRGHGVTSLVDLGLPVDMHDLDRALYDAFEDVFGSVER